jgi:hypothetical protein
MATRLAYEHFGIGLPSSNRPGLFDVEQ